MPMDKSQGETGVMQSPTLVKQSTEVESQSLLTRTNAVRQELNAPIFKNKIGKGSEVAQDTLSLLHCFLSWLAATNNAFYLAILLNAF